MTDRELLELAAKAAGMSDWAYVEKWGCMSKIRHAGGFYFDTEWNPLADDGDALRLAVKLDIEFLPAYTMDGRGVIARDRNNGGNEGFCLYVEEGINGNIYSSTRRAIVRAAAQIGKRMDGNNDIRK